MFWFKMFRWFNKTWVVQFELWDQHWFLILWFSMRFFLDLHRLVFKCNCARWFIFWFQSLKHFCKRVVQSESNLIPERDVWLSSSWICIYCFEYNCVWFICVLFQTLKSYSARELCNQRTEINPCIRKGFSTVFVLIAKIAIEGLLVCREWGWLIKGNTGD